MEDLYIPIGLAVCLLFAVSWLMLHTLITGISTGVLYYRGTAYHRHDPRRFHQSDFWGMFFLYSLYALFIWALFTGSLFILTVDDHGRILIPITALINLAFALRRPNSPKSKPNFSFSVTSLYGVAVVTLFMLIATRPSASIRWIAPVTAIAFIGLIGVHIFRMRFHRFVFKPKKKTKPLKHSS